MRLCPAPFLAATLSLGLQILPAHVQAASPGHDFDFLLGTWHTNISYLNDTGTGAPQWIHFSGTVTNRAIWDGSGDLEQIEAQGPSKHFEGMTLRLYDRQTQQWNLYWSASNDGILQPPMKGSFHGGTGTFFNFETLGKRKVLVRQRYFDATPTSYRFEEATSADGGKTWNSDFTAALTRTEAKHAR